MTKRLFDPEARGRNKLSAYYYSFEATGVPEVDAILAAVASAGKRHHDTEDWYDDDPDAESCVEAIQRMADDAAKAWRVGGDVL